MTKLNTANKLNIHGKAKWTSTSFRSQSFLSGKQQELQGTFLIIIIIIYLCMYLCVYIYKYIYRDVGMHMLNDYLFKTIGQHRIVISHITLNLQ